MIDETVVPAYNSTIEGSRYHRGQRHLKRRTTGQMDDADSDADQEHHIEFWKSYNRISTGIQGHNLRF